MAGPPRHLRPLTAGLIGALALMPAVAIELTIRAREAREQVQQERREFYLEQGRQLLLAGDRSRALVFLNEAYRGAEDDPVARLLVARAAAPFKSAVTDPPTGLVRVLLKQPPDEPGNGWRSADLSPDWARVAALTADGTAALFDPKDGRMRRRLADAPDDFVALRFSPDGAHVAGIGPHGRFALWSVDTGERVFTGAGRVSSGGSRGGKTVLAFSVAGGPLATVSSEGIVRILSSSSEELPASFDTEAHPHTAALRPDGRRLVIAGDRGAMIWNVESGKPIVSLALSFDASVEGIEYSPDGRRIVTPGRSGEVRLWDGATGELFAQLEGHEGAVCCAVWSSGGGLLLTAGEDRTARIWDPERGRLLATLALPGAEVIHAEYGPREERVATVHADGVLEIRSVPLEDFGAAEIERLRRCFVPWRSAAGRLLPAKPDPRLCERFASQPAPWEEREEIAEVPAEQVAASSPIIRMKGKTFRAAGIFGAGYTGESINLVLRDADLVEALRSFASIGRLGLLVAPGIRGTISAEIRGEPWDRALAEILRASDLSYEEFGTVFSPLDPPKGTLAFILPANGPGLASESEVLSGWLLPPESGERINMSLRDADLRETLRSFSGIGDAELTIDGDVSGTVSAEFTSVPWDWALVAYLRLYDLHLEVADRQDLVSPPGSSQGDRHFWRIRRRRPGESSPRPEAVP